MKSLRLYKIVVIISLLIFTASFFVWRLYLGFQSEKNSVRLSFSELDTLSDFTRIYKISSSFEEGIYSESYKIYASLDRVDINNNEWQLSLSDFDTKNNPVNALLELEKSKGDKEYNFHEYVNIGRSSPISLQLNFISTENVNFSFSEYVKELITGSEFKSTIDGKLDSWNVVLGGGDFMIDNLSVDNLRVIGDSILDWSSNIQSEDPLPVFMRFVIEKDEMQRGDSSLRTSLFMIWGLSDYYSIATVEKKAQIVSFIEKELHTFENYSMQSNNWSCNILKDSYDNLSTCVESRCISIRENLKKLCEEDYSLGDVAMPSNGNIKLQESMMSKKQTDDSSEYSNIWEIINPEAAAASSLVAKAEWFKSNEYIEMSENHYREAVSIYSEKSDSVYTNGICTIGIAAIDLYLSTNKMQYKDDADTIISNIDFEDECLSNKQNRFSCHSSVINESLCSIFLSRYAEQFGKTSLKLSAKKLTGDIISRSFDGNDFPGFVNGVGAFYVHSINADSYEEQGYGVYEYDIRLNGQMLNLISKLMELE